ncbi:GntR family transcriptional regulator [Clostridium tagluense]|uniref:GntR family transcriptional regulator n=1 Tax=Clostridium tagluense TaxID=360422 RepID=UPI001C0B716B|nr:GntR family transcriptional regulator [Clostridium tagluense]MBU3128789.1 GntR family transcriptional regulator [Clostridium tagluense]MCB2313040.1 GntR family transcriptional regulator [Clostridium tagluense]MCB2317851.1 GntR family transcriptional regulator [Clostridium tagluense]MCB2322636.1 GntR family transcriptional regulator [Clostridium tagluense]MCB2327589.1 GntR family transcriptional regulator [Clostridium tagluense]
MKLDFNNDVPIYMQIARVIEDNVLKGFFEEETVIPSTTEISVKYKINPATVAKGFNLLVDEGIIYKKRGVGMFVVTGSKEKLIEKRKENFYESYIVSLIEEAKKLDISSSDIIKMIEGEI